MTSNQPITRLREDANDRPEVGLIGAVHRVPGLCKMLLQLLHRPQEVGQPAQRTTRSHPTCTCVPTHLHTGQLLWASRFLSTHTVRPWP